MRTTRLPGLTGALVALTAVALVLAACSSPQSPQVTPSNNPIVELDGFKAEVELSKVDPDALSPQSLVRTTYCPADSNVSYRQVVVPMLGLDVDGIRPYIDVFWMPKNWNGKLLLYAHGYVSRTADFTAADFMSLVTGDAGLLETRDLALCEGNAIGLSSYAGQGYAVQQGIAETHLLNAVFPIIFWRRPSETYVFGHSMGGLITVALAELFPRRYKGAMPMCGPVGGSLAEFSYIGNLRLLFDTAFPGILNGSVDSWVPPDPDWISLVMAAVGDPLWASSFAALVNTSLTFGGSPGLALPAVQTPANYGTSLGPSVDAGLAVNAVLHALRYSVEGGGDAIARGGGSPFSNAGVTYGPLAAGPYVDPSDVFAADPAAILYYTLFYQPSGNLRVPTLSLHGFVDPDVPTVHEVLYRALVTSKGAGAMLRQYLVQGYMPDDLLLMAGADPSTLPPIAARADIRYGHCNFRPADMITALDALVTRVHDGTWPDLEPAGFTPLPPRP